MLSYIMRAMYSFRSGVALLCLTVLSCRTNIVERGKIPFQTLSAILKVLMAILETTKDRFGAVFSESCHLHM